MIVLFNRINKPRDFVEARTDLLKWLKTDQHLELVRPASSIEKQSKLNETEIGQIELWLDTAWQGGGIGGFKRGDEQEHKITDFGYFSLDEGRQKARLEIFVTGQPSSRQLEQAELIAELLNEMLREAPLLQEIDFQLKKTADNQGLLDVVRQLSQDDDWQLDETSEELTLLLNETPDEEETEAKAETDNSTQAATSETDTASSEAGGWLELSVRAVPEAVEPITELFARYGYNGGVVIEEAVEPGPDGGAAIDPTAPVTIRTYISTTDAEALGELDKLREGLFYLGRMLPIEELQVAERQEEDWANAWKEFYQVHRVGRRTVIKPPWQEYQAAPDDIIVEIDPGMAFGTGLHPTTRLCLQLMEDRLEPAQAHKVLDLGTGSGILAIAAARLGVPYTLGLDTDPVAVAAARENVERNGLSNQIEMSTGSLAVERNENGEGGFYSFSEEAQQTPQALKEALPFDAIIANIIARILIALAEPMAAALRTEGLLITSGIIAERAAEVDQALQQAGLTLVERREENDWVAFVHRKPA